MFDSHYVKYGALSGFLLLYAIMLSTIEDNQNSVFAQITPAPEKFGSDEAAPGSSSSNNEGGDEDSISTESSGPSDDNEGQDTISEEGVETTEKEITVSDSEQTNPLLEQIMNQVKEDLTATGMTGFGW